MVLTKILLLSTFLLIYFKN